MAAMPVRLEAEINLDAIVENWKTLNTLSGTATASAVVKADGYGHGMAMVARALAHAGCDLFFTASLDEALSLRAVLPKAKIGYFDGFDAHDHDEVIHHRIMPTIADRDQLQRLDRLARDEGVTIPALLHIDTGMNRLGFNYKEADQLFDREEFKAGHWQMIYSHLASADAPEDAMNPKQQSDFDRLIAHPSLSGIPASLAATAGILLGADYHYDITRPGIGLYGLMPNPDQVEGLRPALSLYGRVLQIRDAEAGETVGYGASETLTRRSRLATIGGGYGDGINRLLSGKGMVKKNGFTARMIGRVSMDVHVVDITDWPQDHLATGDAVTLIGDGLSVHDWAEKCQTIPYEMLTTLGLRAKRHYAGAILSHLGA